MTIGIDWHFPVQLRLGGAAISFHAILETLGIFLAFRYYLWLRRRSGDHIPSANRYSIIIAATFGAVAGSHLLGAAENLPAWLRAADPWAHFWGNKTLVGGLLGGLWSVELVKLMIGEKQRSGDLFVFPLLLGIIIGRLGCLSMGVFEETYGIPTSLPWGMDLGDGVPRHPVVIYELVVLVLLATVLRRLQHSRRLASGALFKIFMIAYLCFRLVLDLVKPGWRFGPGIGSIQLACIAGLIYYFRYLAKPRLLCIPQDTTHAR